MSANHHYVPRFLLRNFLAKDSSRLWVYDKHTDRSFQTSEQGVAAERDFYDIAVEGGTLSLEQGLSGIEAKAAALIQRIVSTRSLGTLSDDERATLSAFVAIQMVRVPHSRERLKDLDEQLRKKLQGRDGRPPAFMPQMKAEDVKRESLLSFNMAIDFAGHIADKTWMLFETDQRAPFCISDNPVVLQNALPGPFPGAGNLGLACIGIEIYMPVSSSLLLAFYCKSHEQSIRRQLADAASMLARVPGCPLDCRSLLRWTRAIRLGSPLPANADNVLNSNSLQVRSAERYVYSSSSDFSLVQDMIADNPRFRRGPRLTVS